MWLLFGPHVPRHTLLRHTGHPGVKDDGTNLRRDYLSGRSSPSSFRPSRISSPSGSSRLIRARPVFRVDISRLARIIHRDRHLGGQSHGGERRDNRKPPRRYFDTNRRPHLGESTPGKLFSQSKMKMFSASTVATATRLRYQTSHSRH